MTCKPIALINQLENFEQTLVARIRGNLQDGASQIARFALREIAEYCKLAAQLPSEQFAGRLRGMAARVRQARPGMAPVSNLVHCWETDVQVFQSPAYAVSRAEDLVRQSQWAVQEAASALARLIGGNQCLLTHSMSSTVKACFLMLADRDVSAIVTESRPGNEGHALAKMLAYAGIKTTYVTDAQMGIFAGRADSVILGADMILADGSAVNKSGSYLLALAAREAGVPLYVCCESYKYADITPGEFIPEMQSPAELNPPRVAGVTAYNQYFEIIPAKLITRIVTEHD